jgi:hypothetical protein
VLDNISFYIRRDPSDKVVATISKSEIKDMTASREEIARELTEAWMSEYRIGSLGPHNWIWTYKITKVEFWDSTSGCMNINVNVITVFPSFMTKWMGLYAETDGLWVKNSYIMIFGEGRNGYTLHGPYSLC